MWPWHGGIAEALTESYWSIGQRIAKEKLNTRARYHNAILTDLSADLAPSPSTKPTNAPRASKA
ncbi:MAG: hypothetical protein JRG70_09290 [Deltaproteobacteria bacterium]|nr:hypothetical protein [Deltaproteobacteria bacterium]